MRYFSIDKDIIGLCQVMQRVPVPDDDIGILADFDRTDSVIDIVDFGCVDRHGLSGGAAPISYNFV